MNIHCLDYKIQKQFKKKKKKENLSNVYLNPFDKVNMKTKGRIQIETGNLGLIPEIVILHECRILL